LPALLDILNKISAGLFSGLITQML
jgi:hypothetical protein